VIRGEHAVRGFRNADIRRHIYPHKPSDPAAICRHTARVSRLLQRLRVHGLIAKIPRCRRYRVTSLGYSLMAAAVHLRQEGTLLALASQPP